MFGADYGLVTCRGWFRTRGHGAGILKVLVQARQTEFFAYAARNDSFQHISIHIKGCKFSRFKFEFILIFDCRSS